MRAICCSGTGRGALGRDVAVDRASLALLVVATAWIAAVLAMDRELKSSYRSLYIGYTAVSGAALVFGGTGVPMKSAALAELRNVHMVFAFYTSIGCALINLPVLFYLVGTQRFVYNAWAILTSLDIFLVNFFAYQAVQSLGYAKASCVWASTGMVVSFMWGIFAFGEPSLLEYSAPAIALLVLGVVAISNAQSGTGSAVSNGMEEGEGGLTLDAVYGSREGDIALASMLAIDTNPLWTMNNEDSDCSRAGRNININNNNPNPPQTLTRSAGSFGLCLLVGLLDGSMMVPFKASGAASGDATLCFLASFGLSNIFVAPVALSAYSGYTNYLSSCHDSERITPAKMKAAAFPGIVSGCLWAAANFLGVQATGCLGIGVGFPLSQTCLIFTFLWGVFFFREIPVSSCNAAIAMFAAGLILVVAGSVLLGLSKV